MTNRLIPTNAEPLYRQLMARIRDDVSSGVYPAESQIPSEQEMCARYGVSRVTVRRAISELTDEGILRKQQGKGTFVMERGNELMRERAREHIMDKLREVSIEAKAANISLLDLLGMFEKAYREQS